jgi:DeoR/GlpR family transcriptional regulator of sugar metabolism
MGIKTPYGIEVKIMPTSQITISFESSSYKNNFLSLSKGDRAIAMKIFEIIEPDMNTFHCGGSTLKWISKELNVTDTTIRNAVSRLKKNFVIESTAASGEYIVDPLIAYKGDIDKVWKSYSNVEMELRKLKEEK